jgi:hypothetical protein
MSVLTTDTIGGCFNEPCRNLIEQCERSAIGTFDEADYAAAKRTVVRRARQEFAETGTEGLAQVGGWLLQQLRLDHLPGWEGMPPLRTGFVGTEEQRRANEEAKAALGALQAALLRDIFGNPFRRWRVDASAMQPEIRRHVVAAYEDRALPEGSLSNHRLMALAQALEAAGCIDPELLGHLRNPERHALGCWAVELLRQGLTNG